MAARWLFRMFLRRRGPALLGAALVAAERAYRERQGHQTWPGNPVPPPTYSSDGRWWWDGTSWHAVASVSPPPAPVSSMPTRITGA